MFSDELNHASIVDGARQARALRVSDSKGGSGGGGGGAGVKCGALTLRAPQPSDRHVNKQIAGVWGDAALLYILSATPQAARGRLHIYRHCDTAHLETLLLKSSAKRKLVVTDTLFSMDGPPPTPGLSTGPFNREMALRIGAYRSITSLCNHKLYFATTHSPLRVCIVPR